MGTSKAKGGGWNGGALALRFVRARPHDATGLTPGTVPRQRLAKGSNCGQYEAELSQGLERAKKAGREMLDRSGRRAKPPGPRRLRATRAPSEANKSAPAGLPPRSGPSTASRLKGRIVDRGRAKWLSRASCRPSGRQRKDDRKRRGIIRLQVEDRQSSVVWKRQCTKRQRCVGREGGETGDLERSTSRTYNR